MARDPRQKKTLLPQRLFSNYSPNFFPVSIS